MARKISNGLDLQSQKITNLGDPSSAQDAASKNYVDNTARGLAWHDSVVAASTANVTVSSAPSTLDGVSLASGDRVLLKDQTTSSEKGIYVFTSAGSALTRATDMAAAAVLKTGTAVSVEGGGTANPNTVWHVTTPSDTTWTVGTTSTTWSQLGGTSVTAGNGISISGGAITAVPTTGITVTGSGIGLDTSVAVRKFAANIGDGSTTAITVTHNLGTRDCQVTVYDATGFDEITCDVNHATTNTVTVTFAVAPTTNQYRVVVQA